MKVRFAVSVGLGEPAGDALASVVEGVEGRGFDTLWLADLPSLPAAEPLAGVGFAAARTRRVRLGANFIPFGSTPYLVAHRLACLDRLTGGRLLVTLVPGLDLPGERELLGTAGRHRGRMMEELVPKLKAWWGGEEVDGGRLPVAPVQQPLEVWLGGSGPDAVQRAGRVSDGWLGSLVEPAEAGRIRAAIETEAARAGRSIDPEHFGLSIGYARRDEDLSTMARLPRGRSRPDLVPVGRSALRRFVSDLIEEGLSKFVIRPVRPAAPEGWDEELDWLAEAVLDMQT